MRQVRYSATFIHQLNSLLAQGEAKFGARVVDEKRELVFDTIDRFLAQFPSKRRDQDINLCTHVIAINNANQFFSIIIEPPFQEKSVIVFFAFSQLIFSATRIWTDPSITVARITAQGFYLRIIMSRSV